MNPIYKFELTAGNTTQQAFPIYKDDLAKDFEKESNQEFFRAKLSGKLTFESDDYTFIVSKSFDTQFVLEIFISYNAGQSWTSYWRGTFWKTDCDFDGDAQTVVVQPTVWDQYNDVLAGLDKEYNLIELAPEIVPVKADKRPMVQVYVPGQSVIGCFLSGMWWEQECNAVDSEDDLLEIYHFSENKRMRVLDVTQTGTPVLPSVVMGTPDGVSYYDITKGGYRFRVYLDNTTDPNNPFYMWEIVRVRDSARMWSFQQTGNFPAMPYNVTLSPNENAGATGTVNLYVRDIVVFARYVTDVESVSGVSAYPIPADDIVENNRNYHYVIGYNFPDTIIFSTTLVSTPTQWGLYQPGQYYYNPADNPITGLGEAFPVARNAWGRVSIWFVFSLFDWIVESSARQPFTIRHAYPISSVISVLLAKIAPGITHAGTTDYSQFLYGQNLIGITQMLLITPKSNLVTAGYDQPAQKAPITLKNVLDMLRDCFRCYWFIDDQNRFRVEHIQYFRNGGSYSGSPIVGIDLTTQQVPRNGKPWAFARDQFKFDKPAMAARYQFGWMDDVTQLFDGYPIDIISKYVNPDNIEQINVSRFTSDIDYILLNPGAVSKDGFALLGGEFYDVLLDGPQTIYKNESGTYINLKNRDQNISGVLKIAGYHISGNLNFVNLYFANENVNDLGFIGTLNTDGQIHTFNCNIPQAATRIRVSGTDDYYLQTYSFITDIISLPYLNFQIENTDHILQNAYVAFHLLQRYYAFDMPAPLYSINGEQKLAQGIKKLKNQTIRFPLLNDPDLVELVKTNLGNGVIEKLSVNLSTRNANATLKYDTE